MPLTVMYPDQIPKINAERIVAKTMVVSMRLFTVAELTSWGFTYFFRPFDVDSQKPVV